jgi:hypothetical protein
LSGQHSCRGQPPPARNPAAADCPRNLAINLSVKWDSTRSVQADGWHEKLSTATHKNFPDWPFYSPLQWPSNLALFSIPILRLYI